MESSRCELSIFLGLQNGDVPIWTWSPFGGLNSCVRPHMDGVCTLTYMCIYTCMCTNNQPDPLENISKLPKTYMPCLALLSDTHTLFSTFTKPSLPSKLLRTKDNIIIVFSSPGINKHVYD